MHIARLLPRLTRLTTGDGDAASDTSSDLTCSLGANQASIAVNSHKESINVYFCNASDITTSILLKLSDEVNCVSYLALTREFQNLELVIITNSSLLVANLSELITKSQRRSFSRSLGFISAFSSPIMSLPTMTEFTITAANIASAVTHNISTTHLSGAVPYCYNSIPFEDRSVLMLALANNVIMAIDYYTSFACQYPIRHPEAAYKGLRSIHVIESTHFAYVQTYEDTHMLLVLHEVFGASVQDTELQRTTSRASGVESEGEEEDSVWRYVEASEDEINTPPSEQSEPPSDTPLHISLLALPQDYFSDTTIYVSLTRVTAARILATSAALSVGSFDITMPTPHTYLPRNISPSQCMLSHTELDAYEVVWGLCNAAGMLFILAIDSIVYDATPPDDEPVRDVSFLRSDNGKNNVVCLGSISVWDLLGRLGGSVLNHNIDFVAFPDDSSIVLSTSPQAVDAASGTESLSPSGRMQALLLEEVDAGRVFAGRREGYGYVLTQAMLLEIGERIISQVPCSNAPHPPTIPSASTSDTSLENIPSVCVRSQDSVFRVSCASEVPIVDWRAEREKHCVDEILVSMYSNDTTADLLAAPYALVEDKQYFRAALLAERCSVRIGADAMWYEDSELLERVRALRTMTIQWILLHVEECAGLSGIETGLKQLADVCAGENSEDDMILECASILKALMNDVELLCPENAISYLAPKRNLGKITCDFAIKADRVDFYLAVLAFNTSLALNVDEVDMLLEAGYCQSLIVQSTWYLQGSSEEAQSSTWRSVGTDGEEGMFLLQRLPLAMQMKILLDKREVTLNHVNVIQSLVSQLPCSLHVLVIERLSAMISSRCVEDSDITLLSVVCVTLLYLRREMDILTTFPFYQHCKWQIADASSLAQDGDVPTTHWVDDIVFMQSIITMAEATPAVLSVLDDIITTKMALLVDRLSAAISTPRQRHALHSINVSGILSCCLMLQNSYAASMLLLLMAEKQQAVSMALRAVMDRYKQTRAFAGIGEWVSLELLSIMRLFVFSDDKLAIVRAMHRSPSNLPGADDCDALPAVCEQLRNSTVEYVMTRAASPAAQSPLDHTERLLLLKQIMTSWSELAHVTGVEVMEKYFLKWMEVPLNNGMLDNEEETCHMESGDVFGLYVPLSEEERKRFLLSLYGCLFNTSDTLSQEQHELSNITEKLSPTFLLKLTELYLS